MTDRQVVAYNEDADRLESLPDSDDEFLFTRNAKMNGKSLYLDAGGGSYIRAPTNNQVDIGVGGSDVISITAATLALGGMNVTTTGTVDGRDVASDGSKLDNIEANADVTDFTNVNAALSAATATIDLDEAVVVNESGADKDFRVEASGEPNALFVQGSDGMVGIGTASPNEKLHLLDTSTNAVVRGRFQNDAQTWTFGVNGALGDVFQITATSSGENEILVDPTTNKTSLITYGGKERSADPGDPAEGEHTIWQSDGTASGDDGDIMMKITAGGVTKTATLVDFSAV